MLSAPRRNTPSISAACAACNSATASFLARTESRTEEKYLQRED